MQNKCGESNKSKLFLIRFLFLCKILKNETNEEKIYDMKELISKNKFYQKLKNINYFKNVKPRGDSIYWEDGEDIAPENLYNKSTKIEEFQGELKDID